MKFLRKSGRGEWIRTTDPSVPNRWVIRRIIREISRLAQSIRPAYDPASRHRVPWPTTTAAIRCSADEAVQRGIWLLGPEELNQLLSRCCRSGQNNQSARRNLGAEKVQEHPRAHDANVLVLFRSSRSESPATTNPARPSIAAAMYLSSSRSLHAPSTSRSPATR